MSTPYLESLVVSVEVLPSQEEEAQYRLTIQLVDHFVRSVSFGERLHSLSGRTYDVGLSVPRKMK